MLNLGKNKIAKLPAELGHLNHLVGIRLSRLNLVHPPQTVISSVILPWAFGSDHPDRSKTMDVSSPDFCAKVKELLRTFDGEILIQLHWCLQCSTLYSLHDSSAFRISSLDRRFLSAPDLVCNHCKRSLLYSGSAYISFIGTKIFCDACIRRLPCKICSPPNVASSQIVSKESLVSSEMRLAEDQLLGAMATMEL